MSTGIDFSQILQALIKSTMTPLTPYNEMNYQNYAKHQGQLVNDPTYDLRGFYQAQQQGMPDVTTNINPYDNQTHYSDGYINPFTGQYISFKKAGSPEKFWEMIPSNSYDDPNVIKNARKLGVY